MASVIDTLSDYPATHDAFFIMSMSNLRVTQELLQQHLPYVKSLLYYLFRRAEISDEKQFQDLISEKLSLDSGEKTMTLAELHEQRGEQRGERKGEQNKSREIAKNMIRKGFEPNLVSEMTGVDISDLEEMINC